MLVPTDKKMRIVLVEDDPAQARALSQVLQKNVFGDVEIVTFTDSCEAATHIESSWVDVLVTDLDMPVLDGLQLVDRARRHNSWTQSLLITAASTASSLIEAGDLGVTDYLLKPVDHQLLVRLIRQLLERLNRWQDALAGTLKRARELKHWQ